MPFWISNSASKELLGLQPLPLLPRTNTTPFPEETEVQVSTGNGSGGHLEAECTAITSAAHQTELRERIEKLYHHSNSSISSISTSSSAMLPYPASAEAVLAGLPSTVPPRTSNDHMETDSIGSISSDMSTTTYELITCFHEF